MKEALAGTLGPPQMTIPVIGTSFSPWGEELHTLLGAGPVTVHITVDGASVVDTPSANVIADGRRRPERHPRCRRPPRHGHRRGRASTTTAPARPRSSRSPSRWPRSGQAENTVRFALWGAEELGLLGLPGLRQTAFPPAQLNKIMLIPELRHGRLAELRPLRLRRQRLGDRYRGPAGVRRRSSDSSMADF